MMFTLLASTAIFLLHSNAAVPEKVSLQFKFIEGSSTTTESTVKVHQVMTIAGMDRESGSDRKITVTRKVGTRGSDGRLPVQQRVDALAVQMQLGPGVSVQFDSANPNVENDNPMIKALLETFQARIGESHTVIFGRDNKVLAVEGAEKVLERASPAAAEMLRGEIDPARIMSAIEESLSVLPSEPISKGDSWTRTSKLRIGGGQTLSFETKYEYLGTVEKHARVLDQIKSTTTSVKYVVDDTAPFKVPRNDLKIASSKGALLFDRERGEMVENTLVTQITGSVTFAQGGMEYPATLDLTIDSTSTQVK